MKYRLGFTLIELLVVISIVGILSSVVLASLQNSRDSARIASTLAFNAHTRHAFGADAAGIWTFDDESGPTINDFTGNHPGTLEPGSGNITTMRSIVTPANYGQSIFFNGQRATFSAPLTIPAVATVSMWVKLSGTADQTFLSVKQAGSPARTVRFGVQTQGQNAGRFLVTDNAASPNGKRTLISNKSINDDKWHHVVWTSNGKTSVANGAMSIIYIDGVADRRDARVNTAITGTGYLGFFETGSVYYTGYLDDVAIYTQPLLASEVSELYLAGLNTHNNHVARTGEVR